MTRTLLITGGAGFVGGNFVRYWYDAHPEDRIIVLDNLTYAGNPHNIPERIHADQDRFAFWYGNVCSIELVDSLMKKATTVVHFAAESHVTRSIFDSRLFFETDVMGTHTIANAVLKHRNRIERFIHISTSEVYGSACYTPMDEDHPLNPSSPYAAAKCGADRLVHSFVNTYGIPAVILRPFNQYGPRQHLEKVVPRFITSALNNEPLTIHGDGEARRDWFHVEDTCQWIDRAISAPLDLVHGQVFNLGAGQAHRVMDLAEIILKLTGRSRTLIQHIGERPGQVDLHLAATDKIERVLGPGPARPLEDGLGQTIDWYRAHPDWWQRLAWMKHVKIVTASGCEEPH